MTDKIILNGFIRPPLEDEEFPFYRLFEDKKTLEEYSSYFKDRKLYSSHALKNAMSEIRRLRSEVDKLIIGANHVEDIVKEHSYSMKNGKKITDSEIIESGIVRAKKQLVYQVELEDMNEKISKGTCDFVNRNPDLKEKIERSLQRQKEKAEKAFYSFITVNPDSERVDFEVFKKAVDKFLKKSWVDEEYYYVYEQRCKDPDDIDNYGKGFHMHALVRTKGKIHSHIQRETYNTFKNVVGSKQHIKIKDVKESRAEYVIKYLLGYKDQKGNTPEKMDAVGIDYAWRIDLDLEQIYFKNANSHFDLTNYIDASEDMKSEGEELEELLPEEGYDEDKIYELEEEDESLKEPNEVDEV